MSAQIVIFPSGRVRPPQRGPADAGELQGARVRIIRNAVRGVVAGWHPARGYLVHQDGGIRRYHPGEDLEVR